MKLLIDVGNQRIKWMTSDQLQPGHACNKISKDADCFSGLLQSQAVDCWKDGLAARLSSAFALLPRPESIAVSTVANSNMTERLKAVCKDLWELTPVFLSSTAYACGITNQYIHPEKLGIDRLTAMIGASIVGQDQSGLLVIDAGTAITVDYLDSNRIFSGGIIFPGIYTMIQCLNHSTGRIRVEDDALSENAVSLKNTSTGQAVRNGVLHSVISTVESAIDYYLHLDQGEFETIITGGDASLIQHLSKSKMQIVPELVFIGILAMSENLVLERFGR